MSFDGEDRRANERDHDLLTRIDVNLSNFMRRFEEHTQEDIENFESLRARAGRLEKFMWVVMGAVMMIETFFKLWNH